MKRDTNEFPISNDIKETEKYLKAGLIIFYSHLIIFYSLGYELYIAIYC